MWELLEAMEAAIKTIPEFKTVNINTEKGINAKDCPAARVVMESRRPEDSKKYFDKGGLHVLILVDLKNNVRESGRQTIDLEEKVRDKVKSLVEWRDTYFDEDSMSVFKGAKVNFGFRRIANTRNPGGCE